VDVNVESSSPRLPQPRPPPAAEATDMRMRAIEEAAGDDDDE
jgi:hypothetical protein